MTVMGANRNDRCETISLDAFKICLWRYCTESGQKSGNSRLMATLKFNRVKIKT